MPGYEAQFLPEEFPEEGDPALGVYGDDFGRLLQEIAEHATGRTGYDAVIQRSESEQLMRRIIGGEDAQGQIDAQGPTAVLRQQVQDGAAAKQQILEVTARLGRRIGINSMGPTLDDAWRPVGQKPGRSGRGRWGGGGGLVQLANLGAQHAEVDDRVQSGIVGVSIALERYIKSFREALDLLEDDQNILKKLPAFSTLVMYASRETIHRHMASPHIRERMGVRIKQDDIQALRDARSKYQVTDLSLVRSDQVVLDQEYAELQRLQDIMEASYHVSLEEDIVFPNAAAEESVYDFEGEPPEPLPLEEVYPDPQGQDGFETVDRVLAREQRPELFKKNPAPTARELTALALYCGFGVDDHEPDDYSLTEIGEMIGRLKEAVYRSKRDAVIKLRKNPERAAILLESLEEGTADGTLARAFSSNRLRTGLRTPKPSRKRPLRLLEAARPRWARAVLGWEEQPGALERGGTAYDLVYRALVKGIFGATGGQDVPDTEATHNTLETYLGSYVTAEHLEDFWNYHAVHLLSICGETDMALGQQRLGSLISRLMAGRLAKEAEIILHPPEAEDAWSHLEIRQANSVEQSKVYHLPPTAPPAGSMVMEIGSLQDASEEQPIVYPETVGGAEEEGEGPQPEPTLPVEPAEPPPAWTFYIQDINKRGPTWGRIKSHALVSRALREAVTAGLDQLTVPDEETSAPYPEQLYDGLSRYLGPHLTSKHIQEFWNKEAPKLLRDTQEINPNRLGQLVSRLLADHIQDTDSITLVIPDAAETRCGYLGAWASRGIIMIVGEAGDYTGAYISGNALVAVEGGVGKYAGAGASGESYLVVDEDAGDFLGAGAGGLSAIAVQGTAGAHIAEGITGQASIVVNDLEWLAMSGVISHRTATASEEAGTVADAPEPEPTAEPEEYPEPSGEPSPEDDNEPAMEREATEVTKPEEVQPMPSEDTRADEWVSASAPAGLSQTEQTLEFTEAASWLEVSESELRSLAVHIGHDGQSPLTLTQFLEIKGQLA